MQTIAPEARSIAFAARHDSDGFLADELERRAALSYPPFSSLVRIVCSAEQAARARSVATVVRAGLGGIDASVLGPAPLFKLRGRERQAIVVKAPFERRSEVIRRVGEVVQGAAGAREHAGVAFSVDVDPQ